MPGLRYAARVNGLDGLAITKLDVLTGLKKLRACVAYETPAGRTDEFPIDLIDEPGAVQPVYEELPGWQEPLTAARTLDALPGAARDYVRFIESQVGVPAFLVGVGPRRDETIVVVHPFDER